MPRTLNLLCFRQSYLFPENFAHWALYLRDQEAKTGTVFHASKESLTNRTTLYDKVRNINPMQSKSIRSSVEVASEVELTDERLDEICLDVAQNRPFDLVINNCQRFCSQILQRLVNSKIITQEQFDALASKGFQPLV